MEFKQKRTIYQQIAESICEKIMEEEFIEEEKIPSIRSLAVDLQVNPNTIQRTCRHGIGQINVANRQRSCVSQPRIGLDKCRAIRSARDHWRVIGSSNRHSHCFGITQRCAIIVGGADGVSQYQRFTRRQEIERFNAAVKIPGQCIGRFRAIQNRSRIDAEEAL